MMSDGGVKLGSSNEIIVEPAVPATFSGGVLRCSNGPILTLSDRDHAKLQFGPQFVPLLLVRDRSEQKIDTRPMQAWPPDIVALRERLERLVAEDQTARMSFDFDRIKQADRASRKPIFEIMDRYGWLRNP